MCDQLKWATQNGEVDNVKSLLAAGDTNVNANVGNNRTLLHIAADYGQTEVIDLLVNHGADVNKLDDYGISPLLSAVFEGHTKAVELLLQKGADKSVKGPDGSPCIDCAEKQEIKELLK